MRITYHGYFSLILLWTALLAGVTGHWIDHTDRLLLPDPDDTTHKERPVVVLERTPGVIRVSASPASTSPAGRAAV